jgi:hypothetical protein
MALGSLCLVGPQMLLLAVVARIAPLPHPHDRTVSRCPTARPLHAPGRSAFFPTCHEGPATQHDFDVVCIGVNTAIPGRPAVKRWAGVEAPVEPETVTHPDDMASIHVRPR